MFMLALQECCQAGQLFPPTLLMCSGQLCSRHVSADETADVDITPVDCCLATSIARIPITDSTVCCLLLVLLVVVNLGAAAMNWSVKRQQAIAKPHK
jgi:hypothetical protein